MGREASIWIRKNLWTWDGRMQAEVDRLDQLMDSWESSSEG